jgi:hypothetical protein
VNAVRIIDRLDRPKQTRPGCWVAGCPCCQSRRGRPVSVRVLEDERILLHAFCGCGTDAVLAALGLTLGDLFPERLPGHNYPQPHSRIPVRDLLEAIDHEITVAAIILADARLARAVTDEQWQRVAQAAARIGAARDHARG